MSSKYSVNDVLNRCAVIQALLFHLSIDSKLKSPDALPLTRERACTKARGGGLEGEGREQDQLEEPEVRV